MPRTEPMNHRPGRHRPGRLLWVVGLVVGIAAGTFAAIELTTSQTKAPDGGDVLH